MTHPRELLRFAATTGQSAPDWRIGTFGLAGLPLVPFPLASPIRFSSSIRKPEIESRPLYTGHRMASKPVSSMLFPELAGNPGFDAVYGVSMRHRRFTCARLLYSTHMSNWGLRPAKSHENRSELDNMKRLGAARSKRQWSSRGGTHV